MKSIVSIIVPCRNAGPYIGAALDSVLAQTWRNCEIIVVNDGSSDNSEEVLSRYAERGVRVIHEECNSAARARNRGLREATGKFIKFFDADDLLGPTCVESQVNRIGEAVDVVASSEWGRFYEDDPNTYRASRQSVWRDMCSREWLVESWHDARPMMQPGVFLVPRELLDLVGGWDESLTLIDDFEFFARVLSAANEVRFSIGARLYYRSGLKGSLSSQAGRGAVESAYRSLILGTGHLLARRNDVQSRRSCANLFQDFVYTYYPDYAVLRDDMTRRVSELGGSDLAPSGPPRFQKLRRIIGWKMARRIQRLVAR